MARGRSEQVRKDLGRRVAELRRAKGLTQAQFAEASRVTTNYIARVEGGLENLTLDSVAKFGDLLQVPVLHLFLPPADRTVKKGRPRTPPRVGNDPPRKTPRPQTVGKSL